MTLRRTVPVGAFAFGFPYKELLSRDAEKHVSLKALPLRLLHRQLLTCGSEEYVSFEAPSTSSSKGASATHTNQAQSNHRGGRLA